VITNWDAAEEVYKYLFDCELRVCVDKDDGEVRQILHTEAILNPKQNRERITQILFESFNLGELSFQYDPLLVTAASGRSTALAMCSGAGVTQVLPVVEGMVIPGAAQRSNWAGDQVDKCLKRLLATESDIRDCDPYNVRKIKEDLCYVSLNYSEEVQPDDFAGKEKEFEMPDRSTVVVGSELIQAPEILFTPTKFGGRREDAVQQLCFEALSACNIFARSGLLQNLVVAGNNTRIDGYPERLEAELTDLVPQNSRIRVTAPPERGLSTWIGGSIIMTQSHARHMTTAITSDQYEEIGPYAASRLPQAIF